MNNSSRSYPIPFTTLLTHEKDLKFISNLDWKIDLVNKLKSGLINKQYVNIILEIWENLTAQKIDYISFINISLPLITIPVPKVGITAPFLSLFFPKASGICSTVELPDVFTGIKQDMHKIFNLILTDKQIKHLNKKMLKLETVTKSYTDILHEIKSNPVDYFTVFNNADVVTAEIIDEFIRSNYKEFLTPYFSLLATIHLMIYRDMIVNGEKWGFSEAFINQKKADIKRLIQRYIPIGDKLFEKDLNSLLENGDDNSIQRLALYGPAIYRLWPNLDPDIYPVYTQLEKTIPILSITKEKIFQDKTSINYIEENDGLFKKYKHPSTLENIDVYKKNIILKYNIDYSNNIIGDIDLGENNFSSKIKGISVANYSNNQGELVTEWINGGSTVKLSPTQIVTIPITVLDTHVYQIRLRYATENNVGANMWMCIQNDQTGDMLLNTKLSFTAAPMDSNSIQGKYGKYVLNIIENNGDDKNITLNAGSYTIFIKNIMEKSLFLDRIEFYKNTIKNNTLIMLPARELVSPPSGGLGWTNLWVAQPSQIGKAFEAKNSVSEGEYKFYLNNVLVGSTQGNTFYENFDTVQINFYNCIVDTFNSFTGANIWIEKPSQECFKSNLDLESIRKQVNSLFIGSFHKKLSPDTTDYLIDQVALKINGLSNEIFGKEKMELRKLVNHAKHLSKNRNLLVGGNFENLDNWYLGRRVIRIEGDQLFKGYHLLLPPSSDYLSYAYQKIDKSKLKPNTRYIISGFIAQAISLNIIVSCYENEINQVLNVPYEEVFPIHSEAITNCCISSLPFEFNNIKGFNSHFFRSSIHVGDLQTESNLGIEFALRITSPTGFAKLSNIEIYEDRSLTNNEICRIKRTEHKWKKAFIQSEADIAAQLQPVIHQINNLYQNKDWNHSIRSNVMFQDVQAIKLPDLPGETHWLMEDRIGIQYTIMQQMKRAIQYAFAQLEERNLLRNGNFAEGLTDWISNGNCKIILLEEQNKVLSLLHWDASITQSLEIVNFNSDQTYQLRVYGKGSGTIMIQHGDKIESMSFSSQVFMSKPSHYMFFETATIEVYIVSEGVEFIIDNVQLTKTSREENEII
ncbi:insecticidal delta-endotoxin Cry8Ea1 family protein [Bacillus mycoides]|uniref:insecticidal delta-endotoxin Cry8Ea1 family protein n=1 Tax=Bacillus mycoides TaxID=1405 RepID=UPI003D1CD79E